MAILFNPQVKGPLTLRPRFQGLVPVDLILRIRPVKLPGFVVPVLVRGGPVDPVRVVLRLHGRTAPALEAFALVVLLRAAVGLCLDQVSTLDTAMALALFIAMGVAQAVIVAPALSEALSLAVAIGHVLVPYEIDVHGVMGLV